MELKCYVKQCDNGLRTAFYHEYMKFRKLPSVAVTKSELCYQILIPVILYQSHIKKKTYPAQTVEKAEFIPKNTALCDDI